MNITFFGEDEYSAIVLNKLIHYCHTVNNYKISLVITTQPKPKNRNKLTQPNPIEKLATNHDLKYLYYNANSNELNKLIKTINSIPSELAVLTSFGHILPAKLIEAFPKGIINLHPSRLPQYRGATPVPYSILMGDQNTALTIFKITPKIDDGEILSQIEYDIEPDITSPELLTELFSLGADKLNHLLDNNFAPEPYQMTSSPEKLIYAPKFTRNDGFISWETFQHLASKAIGLPNNPQNKLLALRIEHNPPVSLIEAVYDLLRALTPWPGLWTIALTKSGEKRLKITQIKPEIQVQLEGKPNPVPYSEFAKYHLKS